MYVLHMTLCTYFNEFCAMSHGIILFFILELHASAPTANRLQMLYPHAMQVPKILLPYLCSDKLFVDSP